MASLLCFPLYLYSRISHSPLLVFSLFWHNFFLYLKKKGQPDSKLILKKISKKLQGKRDRSDPDASWPNIRGNKGGFACKNMHKLSLKATYGRATISHTSGVYQIRMEGYWLT